MADKEDQPEALSGEEALALARKGKEAWNAWATKSEGRKVDFLEVNFTTEDNNDISFEGFTFPGNVDFRRVTFMEAQFKSATFKGRAEFQRAVFNGDTFFQGAIFVGDVEFLGVTFERHAGFGGAIFNKGASFLGVTFASSVSLERSAFCSVPDFRRCEFGKHVTLYSMHVEFKRPPEAGHADKYRRLKELAVAARDHDREQMFFACELKAKRGHETRGLALVPNHLYELTSDFGRSLARPASLLVLTWFYFGLTYSAWFGKAGTVINGLLYSAAHLIPFLPGSRKRLEALEAGLFDGPVPDAVFALTLMEGVLGIVFIFLIGLTLRNRFRI